MKPIYFTKEDAGCYGDGTLGHGHVRSRLAELIEPFNSDLYNELCVEGSDDLSEEDEALEILGEHSSAGMVWDFQDGDLVLYYDPEQDPECFTYESFPEWAIQGMEYGAESLEGENREDFEAWMAKDIGERPFVYSTKEGEEGGFSWHPEFGKPTNTVTLYLFFIDGKEGQ